MKKENKDINGVDKNKKNSLIPILVLSIVMFLCILTVQEPVNKDYMIIMSSILIIMVGFFYIKYPKNKFVIVITFITIVFLIDMILFSIVGFVDCKNSLKNCPT